MSRITTHVLDTARGQPAAGIDVALDYLDAEGAWRRISHGTTDADGRLATLLDDEPLQRGTYRLTFDVADLYRQTFYRAIPIIFEVDSPGEHYHVPLLISPFGYSTYRGS